MPWRCPACQIAIQHSEDEEKPRHNHTYRCHVCRLELVLDDHSGRLAVAARHDNALDEKVRPTQ